VSALPRIGFVGVGTIAEALITGLCANGEQRGDFLLSPRSPDRVARLAAAHPFVTVTASNQAVVDGADIVFLAVTPQIAEDVIGELAFRPEQHVVSLIATYDIARLRPLVAPATTLSRVIPLPAAARRTGPLILYPPSVEIGALLDGVGELVRLEDEAQVDALLAVTGLMGSYFGLLGAVSGWLEGQGVAQAQAEPFVGSLFNALGDTAMRDHDQGFEQLVAEHSTPGGLNEQGWRELKAAGWGALVGDALELIRRRIAGQATLDDRLGR
jgi:pyrroline-5-carboxylate reductase